MILTTDLLKSKIARRFFLLFFFCALIPTLGLFFISFYRVTDQVKQQNDLNMMQETKAYGFSLFDRLLRANETIRIVQNAILSEKTAARKEVRDFLSTSPQHIFEAVTVYYPEGNSEPLWGHLDDQEVASIVKDFKGEQQTRIVFRDGGSLIKRIFLLVPAYQDQKLVFLLVSEVNPTYIWGIGSDSLLPARTNLSVYDEAGHQVIGSIFSPGDRLNAIHKEKINADLRLFSYSVGGERFLASSWTLFVKSNFVNNSWTIILSISDNDILSNIYEFKKTFLSVLLLVLLVILLLSLVFIRRNLQPLGQLIEGTQQIARKNFSVMLDINSGDEFEELGASFNSMTKQLQKQIKTLETIDTIDRAILSSLDQHTVVDTSLKMLKEFFQVDCIILGNLKTPTGFTMKLFVLKDERNPMVAYVTMNEKEKRLLFAGEPFSIVDKSAFPQFLQEHCPGRHQTILVLPLVMDNTIQSVLMLEQKFGYEYGEEEVLLARQLADQVTIALSNASLVNDLERLIHGTLEALARTVDAKSKWTAGHSERVADLAGRLGKHMGLTEKQTELLNRGGLLHDIGKIGIPITILDKPGSLDDDEYEQIKAHPLIGRRILEPIEAYQDILPIIAQHHERYDGKGYPLGLSGEAIDPLARILIVADVFDALISNRPYRDGWILQNAKNFIVEGAGTHFDPNVVKAFLELSEG